MARGCWWEGAGSWCYCGASVEGAGCWKERPIDNIGIGCPPEPCPSYSAAGSHHPELAPRVPQHPLPGPIPAGPSTPRLTAMSKPTHPGSHSHFLPQVLATFLLLRGCMCGMCSLQPAGPHSPTLLIVEQSESPVWAGPKAGGPGNSCPGPSLSTFEMSLG